MNHYQQIKKLLFLDIETVVSVPNFDDLSPEMQEIWTQKAFYMSKDISVTDLYVQRAGIYAEFGKVVSIAIAYFRMRDEEEMVLRVKSFTEHNEKYLLEDFANVLNKFADHTILVAHNGKEFDYPYLCRRMLVNAVDIPNLLQIQGKKSWEIVHLDTMEMWRFGDKKNYASLKLLASLFNLSPCKAEMNGSMMSKVYFEEKNLNKIDEYCRSDVKIVAQLFLCLKNLPRFDVENIMDL